MIVKPGTTFKKIEYRTYDKTKLISEIEALRVSVATRIGPDGFTVSHFYEGT